eukprot:g66620.t1
MEQRYRPGEPDEPLPMKTPRPTQPKWRTKRTLDMLQEPPPDNQPRPSKTPRNKPTKWTLQKEQFESSINASIEAQLGPQEQMTRAVTAAHPAGTNMETPQPGETSSTPQITVPPVRQNRQHRPVKHTATRLVYQQTLTEVLTFLRTWTQPPHPNTTWKRWEQLAETMQPLTTDQTEDLKEAEYTIARARDQLNRAQQRLQTDARLRAMPDRTTQNME